jgi:hypothetical protein
VKKRDISHGVTLASSLMSGWPHEIKRRDALGRTSVSHFEPVVTVDLIVIGKLSGSLVPPSR